MNDPRITQDDRWQAAAEAGDAGDPEAARYRRLFVALRQVDSPRPPLDFAAGLERRVAAAAASPSVESEEGVGIRVGLAALFVLAVLAPATVAWLMRGHMAHVLPGAPWRLLLAAAAGMLLLGWMDRKSATAR
jgi:hypothetical protein